MGIIKISAKTMIYAKLFNIPESKKKKVKKVFAAPTSLAWVSERQEPSSQKGPTWLV